MRERIEQQLNVLVGLPLFNAGRAADLEWFEFGGPQKRVMRDGRTKDMGEYALHIQCAWRIRADHEIVVASRDLYYPPGDSFDIPENFEWDVPQGNRRDHRLKSFLQDHALHPLIVTTIEADEVGSIKLSLTKNFALEVFPDDSFADSEHWRFFRLNSDAEHFVVTGRGIQE